MNCDFPAWATWTGVVVVIRCVETGSFSFFYPAGGCSIDAAIYPAVGFPLDLTCPQSTRGLLWWLGACFLADHLVLVV
jgi:hypothetical protein